MSMYAVHLQMAIDRESLTKALTFGYAEIANTVLPRALLYQTNDTVNALSYDIDAAKEELAQSAYPDGFDTTISIASGNNTRLQEAQIIQAAGAQIGINIEINAQEISNIPFRFPRFKFLYDDQQCNSRLSRCKLYFCISGRSRWMEQVLLDFL